MSRALMVSPHFPPDSSAGAHRVRLLAPHLASHGWEPTVVSVDPRDYESRLDPDLAALVPSTLRLVRCRAWSPARTRRLGFGDLGLRAFAGLFRTCASLLEREHFDALFITLYPSYPALLGRILKRRFGVPFVLDYQDPWVGAWGREVGGGPGGAPDRRSRASRALAERLEPWTLEAVDALTSVSARTVEEIKQRNPSARDVPSTEIPIGFDARDFAGLRARPRLNPHFDPADGAVHLCYVGTLLPLGLETLRALFRGAAELRDTRPELYRRLRFHFFGTSNQTRPAAELRVLPVARALGVAELVTEVAPRLDYLDALNVQLQASAILLLGSSEPHYTASKIYPALLSGRPLLAIYHSASAGMEALGRAVRRPGPRLVTYDDHERAESRSPIIARVLAELAKGGDTEVDGSALDPEVLAEYSAESLAGRLARVLEQATRGGRC